MSLRVSRFGGRGYYRNVITIDNKMFSLEKVYTQSEIKKERKELKAAFKSLGIKVEFDD